MRRFMYVLLTLTLAVSFLMAKDIKAKKFITKKDVKLSAKANLGRLNPVEPMAPYAVYPVNRVIPQNNNHIYSTDPATNRQVATSGNGYGWLNSNVRSIDRYAGPDADSGDPIDFVAIAYRGTESDANGSALDIRETEVDVSGGLASGTIYNSDKLNDGLGGIGGRYPCMVAQDRPFPSYNQYMESNSTTGAAVSHPHTISSYGTYGDNGNAWTAPDYQMDEGWLAPTIQDNSMMTQENRLWNGAVVIKKDGTGQYRYLSVYEEWYSANERQLYGVQSEKYIFTARTDDPSSGWTYGWDEGYNPVRIDTDEVSLPRCGVDMTSDGFGVIAGPGHLGWHNPDSGYYYNKTKITYSITEDYGHTWSAWDTVSFNDIGIPNYHHASDSIIFDCQVVNGDTICTPYDGPTFSGTNFDMSVLVDDNKTIYVAFNSLWGEPASDGWYPYPDYSGIWIAKKPYGGAWEGHHVAYNNGAFVGDEQIEGMSRFFFDSEVQVSMDEQGHLYMAWLDRRHTDVQVSRFARYADPDDYNGTIYNDYKTDVYASHSIDGGVNWSDPINCTDSPALDEYELNMSKSSANQDVRGDYGKIWYAYCLADTANGDPAHDAYIELTNFDYIGEASNFNPPAAIGDNNNAIVKNFGLQQNYPNPFNPSTTIEFTPQKSGKAQLIVYNSAGQQVATLFNGQVQKNTPYHLTFDGHNLASGVYFYQLQMDNKTEIKKMVLIK